MFVECPREPGPFVGTDVQQCGGRVGESGCVGKSVLVVTLVDQKIQRHKFGVVYGRQGLGEEETFGAGTGDQMILAALRGDCCLQADRALTLLVSAGLESTSEHFQNFLDFLGERVELKGWTRYKGDLDVKSA